MNLNEEKKLVDEIRRGNEAAFEKIFRRYYRPLCLFATKILGDDETAEEVVQDFFVKLWERREGFIVETSVKNYLFRSVKNLSINVIKHEQIKLKHAQQVMADAEANDFKDHFTEVDLERAIEKSIEELPEKRREIFRLSREEGLKYREIAERMNISIKTVEVQMGLAIRTLRDKLKKYSTFLFFFVPFYQK
ncbi:RNA polymerase sigma-70 factor [Maribellus sp. CM-23]|uniref:RNA polymerase sigma-70 factor n=1 Tax=Maribellus sp. CM-23 TaxID=2781026 RepID=UPI001F219C44|nr:RNA polymerase sigma-70 factor [Maribellus sp. CM-23]MCE4563962.1 RNA polymerase sigma-70 factor [Maribellus sp. CM-23]